MPKIVVAKTITPLVETIGEVFDAEVVQSDYCPSDKMFVMDPDDIRLGPMDFEFWDISRDDDTITSKLTRVGDLILKGDD